MSNEFVDNLIEFLKMPTREAYATLPPFVQRAGRVAAVPIRKMNHATPTPVKMAMSVPVVASIPVVPLGMVLTAKALNGVSRLLMPLVKKQDRPNTHPAS